MALLPLLLRSRHFAAGLMFATLAAALFAAQPSVLPASASSASHGAAALARLGDRLPAVALAHGLTPAGLTALFNTDPSLGLDASGEHLFYVCANVVRAGTAAPTTASAPLATYDPQADTFALHSLPGASKTIYLDFDGHVTSGTNWNASYTGGADIVSAPWDPAGDGPGFSAGERALIYAIWQRVAEDYAPFAVNVTTADPGVEALRKSASNDQVYGVRVVISPTNWYKLTAGGVAYIGSFSYNTDTPCFAFSDQLLNGEKYIAEAVAHEVGHTLGLYHDGVSGVTEYYEGHGDWAPIMGVGYYRNLVQFSKGEYSSPSNTQDDVAVIAGFVPLLTDDHGDTLGTATPLAGPQVGDGGTISTRTDVDLFRLDSAAGFIDLSITSPSTAPNLDVRADLLNSSGGLVVAGAASGLGARVTASVAAGTYYLRVDGGGTADYTDYGSLGNYLVTGSFPTDGVVRLVPLAAATASPSSGTAPLTVSFNSSGSSDPDGSIILWHWAFGDGATSGEMAPVHVYTSVGTFTATLTVTDNDGLTASASRFITVSAQPPPPPPPTLLVDVVAYSLSITTAKNGSTVSAAVTILDDAGEPVAGTTVTLQWSGLATGNSSGVTNAAGQVVLKSKPSKKRGTVTGTVVSVTPPPGATYAPTLYPAPTTLTVSVN